MAHLKHRALGLLTLLTLASTVQANSCDIDASKSGFEAIIAYQTCIDTGHQMVTSIRTELGTTAFQSNKYKEAVVHFSEIIDAEARPGKAYFHRALAYLELGKERRALRDLESANQELPGYSPAHFYRGATLHQLRRYQQAIDAYNMALNLSSGGTALAPIYFEKAQSEIKRKYFTAALESFDNALVSDPNYTRAYFNRAQLHERQGARELAIADYSQYISAKPESAEAHYNRGLIYQRMRRDHQAISDFNRAIELNPRYVKARASKGLTYFWPAFPVVLILLLG